MNNQVAEMSAPYVVDAEQKQVPEGYKQTEVGVIPEDWECAPASDLMFFLGGFAFSSRAASSSGTRWLKIANVGVNEIKWGIESFLPDAYESTHKEFLLTENDVVMALTRPLLGDDLKVSRLKAPDTPALLNQRVAKIVPKKSNGQNFSYYVVQNTNFIAAMNLAMAGSDPPNIGTKTLGEIQIALPNSELEQTAIANALSDADALISELEKLIGKKQAIKTAAMQQLLTGRTRLPQFAHNKDGSPKGYKQSELGEIPEDWELRPLGELVQISSGESPSKYQFKASGIPYFKVEQLNNGAVYAKSTPYFIETTKTISAKSVVFPKRGASIFSNKIRVLHQDSFIDTNLMALTCTRELNELYLYGQLTYRGLDSVADTTSIPQINNKHIVPFLVLFPARREQTAIATILSDVDDEIQTLQQRLDKTRQIKQGMMQELLTGKTRLVTPEAAND